jgi:hypothetical protein
LEERETIYRGRGHSIDCFNCQKERRTDEVKARTTVIAQICGNEIDFSWYTTKGTVERAGPYLGIAGELEGCLSEMVNFCCSDL